ncbi:MULTISPECIES: transposase [unclassified Streptomyces]|uniref:transposase n=1 Tax=unclassified Streptomyces TaxID=2593676 RepID=UPI0023B86712|nr:MULTISPECIES: transposase [unclassified Streptomyces]
MRETTGWDRRLTVAADGRGLIGHAGAVLLRRLADRVGLTAGLAEVLPVGSGADWRDRAVTVVQLAVAIALGAVNLSDAEAVQDHHRGLFGSAVSDSTMYRALAAVDAEALAKIAKVRARVRRHVWSLLHLRLSGFPWLTIAGKRLHNWVVIDLDATIITAASKKERASATFKKTFGFHPLAAWCATTSECLAMWLREGNAACSASRPASSLWGWVSIRPRRGQRNKLATVQSAPIASTIAVTNAMPRFGPPHEGFNSTLAYVTKTLPASLSRLTLASITGLQCGTGAAQRMRQSRTRQRLTLLLQRGV